MQDPTDMRKKRAGAKVDLEATQHPLTAGLLTHRQLDEFIPGSEGLARDHSDGNIARLRTNCFGMITEVDAQIGRLLESLETADSGGDSIVVFTSNHGEMLGD